MGGASKGSNADGCPPFYFCAGVAYAVLESVDIFQLIVGQGPGMTFALVILYIMIRDKKDQSLRDVALTEAIHKLAMEIQALRFASGKGDSFRGPS